ncbi:hypothetical protein [Photobacterium leiognathi]|uniref:hypothetical protein n=1 Tax=Photobacterium leiognathi TaxID=553611 RepID=UPI0029828ABE|nr:hypothetical protein [Photobacterium leiognathi]
MNVHIKCNDKISPPVFNSYLYLLTQAGKNAPLIEAVTNKNKEQLNEAIRQVDQKVNVHLNDFITNGVDAVRQCRRVKLSSIKTALKHLKTNSSMAEHYISLTSEATFDFAKNMLEHDAADNLELLVFSASPVELELSFDIANVIYNMHHSYIVTTSEIADNYWTLLGEKTDTYKDHFLILACNAAINLPVMQPLFAPISYASHAAKQLTLTANELKADENWVEHGDISYSVMPLKNVISKIESFDLKTTKRKEQQTNVISELKSFYDRNSKLCGNEELALGLLTVDNLTSFEFFNLNKKGKLFCFIGSVSLLEAIKDELSAGGLVTT